MFVLDANVLLNLYRYPQQAREDFISLLRQIQDRLWIPHQAALEYQENRLRVIAEQVKRFNDVRKVLNENRNKLRGDLDNLQLSKRHSSIDPERLLSKVSSVYEEFEQELAGLEKEQPDVYDKDQIRDVLDAKGGVEGFYMYTPERFLEYAKANLGAQVKEESIEQVRDIASLYRQRTDFASISRWGFVAEQAVLRWLHITHPSDLVIENERGFPDFFVVGENSGYKAGYEVKALREPQLALRIVQDTQYRAFYELANGDISEFFLVLVLDSYEKVDRTLARLERLAQDRPQGIRYVVGMLARAGDDAQPILEVISTI